MIRSLTTMYGGPCISQLTMFFFFLFSFLAANLFLKSLSLYIYLQHRIDRLAKTETSPSVFLHFFFFFFYDLSMVKTWRCIKINDNEIQGVSRFCEHVFGRKATSRNFTRYEPKVDILVSLLLTYVITVTC